MKHLIISSMRKDAGKTSLIVGIAKAFDKQFGYLKPFGDRLLYQKKRLWDYDSAVALTAMQTDELPEDMSIGFDHSKLRYMYDQEGTQTKISEMVDHLRPNKEILLYESGHDIVRGISVHLDALSLCRYVNGQLVVVLSGNTDQIMDDAVFLQQHIELGENDFAGVVVNKIRDPEDFHATTGAFFKELGLSLLGVLPHRKELTYPNLRFIADVLFARVIAGEKGLEQVVKETFVGAMSGDAVMRLQRFKKKEKLVITSGDRSDMILAALQTEAAGIVLTNNILPPPNIIAQASEKNTPLLLVSTDTFQTAKKIDSVVPLLGKGDDDKMKILGDLVREHTSLEELL